MESGITKLGITESGKTSPLERQSRSETMDYVWVSSYIVRLFPIYFTFPSSPVL